MVEEHCATFAARVITSSLGLSPTLCVRSEEVGQLYSSWSFLLNGVSKCRMFTWSPNGSARWRKSSSSSVLAATSPIVSLSLLNQPPLVNRISSHKESWNPRLRSLMSLPLECKPTCTKLWITLLKSVVYLVFQVVFFIHVRRHDARLDVAAIEWTSLANTVFLWFYLSRAYVHTQVISIFQLAESSSSIRHKPGIFLRPRSTHVSGSLLHQPSVEASDFSAKGLILN